MKMPSTKTNAVILFFISLILGLGLFLYDKISSNQFIGYFIAVLIASVAVYLSDRLKSLNLLKGQMELFEQARDDIREYMFEVYELQLCSIASAEELSIPTGSSKARAFDLYMDIHAKAQKHQVVDRLRNQLTDALTYVMQQQEILLKTYSQYWDENMSRDIEERITAYLEQANFEAANHHLGNREGGMTVTNARQLLDASIQNMRSLVATRL